MQMIFSSFVLPHELKRAWKKAARLERISGSEFLRRAIRERLEKQSGAVQSENRGERPPVAPSF